MAALLAVSGAAALALGLVLVAANIRLQKERDQAVANLRKALDRWTAC